jgi:flagellar biosynthetic protein FlhB
MGDASDRTIPATPRRREAARRAGLSAPADLPAWAASGATTLALAPWWARATIAAAADDVRETFTATLAGDGMGGQAWPLPAAVALPTIVVVAAAAAAGLGARFACDGLSCQPRRVVPDLRRIDPLAGLARIFSRATLGTLLTAAAGLVILVATAVVAGRPLLAVQATPPEPGELGPLAAVVWRMLAWLVTVAAAVTGCQWMLARRRLERRIRMTPQELAEEQKEMQADPRVRLFHQRRVPRPRAQQSGTS